jgi:hypothetical protein
MTLDLGVGVFPRKELKRFPQYADGSYVHG